VFHGPVYLGPSGGDLSLRSLLLQPYVDLPRGVVTMRSAPGPGWHASIIRRNPSMFIRDREEVIPEVDQLGTVNGCGRRDRWRCRVVDEYLPDWDCDVSRPANCDPADSFPVDRPDSAYEIANRPLAGAAPNRRRWTVPQRLRRRPGKCCKSGASRTDGCDRCRSLAAEQANISGTVKPVNALGAA
jgi:hypothetical protein